MLYVILILLGLLVSILLGATFGINTLSFTLGEIMRCVFVSFILLFIIDLIVALIVRWFLPKKLTNPFLKIYTVHNWERKFYTKLGIRFWKDKIPEAGKLFANFDKSKVNDISDNTHLYKFMQETIYAENMHFLSAIFGLFVVFVNLRLWHLVALPLIIVNAIINLMPVMVQRYNRPRLMAAYLRNERNLAPKGTI